MYARYKEMKRQTAPPGRLTRFAVIDFNLAAPLAFCVHPSLLALPLFVNALLSSFS